MNYFLAKTDPSTYSVDQFVKDHQTAWDGIKNPQAIKAIQAMRKGDKVLIYHSQGEAAIVGLAKVISDPRPDTRIVKSWVVDMEFLVKFKEPITLKEIKATSLFDRWNLVYQSRLSTMSVPLEFIQWLKEYKRINI